MADAINTGNPVDTTNFIVNKYHDIDGARLNQQTARGRLCFKDSNGRMTLPRTFAEAVKSVFPVDWPKPLNPGPYFTGPGLNGTTVNVWNDGSLGMQETDFELDPDAAYSANWPTGVTQYDIPLAFYNLPMVSGNKALVYDGGTFTFGSGNFQGDPADFVIGAPVYAGFLDGYQGMLVASGITAVGRVVDKNVFGDWTITVKLKGINAL